MSLAFTTSALYRLKDFLGETDSSRIERLTPDASTREFFRIHLDSKPAIACVYPERFDESLPQIDVTNLFLKSGLPVARIFDVDYDRGLLLHEDFGDRILRDVLRDSDSKTCDDLLNRAISLIAKIQKSTQNAFTLNSIASKLKFDEEKLLWELNFFKTHYFGSVKKKTLSKETDQQISQEFTELSRELEGFATVLTHRDFHAANLMLDDEDNLKIIDHQDARIGSITYDLVSLLLDRITEVPTEERLTNKKNFFLNEREKLGLESVKTQRFEYEFDLMTIQRCLKAIGTFSNQAGNFGKIEYVQYIKPMFEAVVEACTRLDKFPVIQRNFII